MEQLEIKGNEDKLEVAKILVANGYTVRIATVKEDGKKAVSVLQYEKNNNRRIDV